MRSKVVVMENDEGVRVLWFIMLATFLTTYFPTKIVEASVDADKIAEEHCKKKLKS
jgi:hypothetical protein